MTEEALDLRRSLRIVRRYKFVIGLIAALGVLGGVGYIARYPPMPSSSALVVVLPTSARDISTQVVIASSNPVLAGALRRIKPAIPLQVLRNRVHVTKLTANVLSISAAGNTAAAADGTANAVAHSYIHYVSTKDSAAGPVRAKLLASATDATGMSPRIAMLIAAVLGALAGALIGSLAVLAVKRGDRRLRQRGEIADAIGVSVLASISVRLPSNAEGWTRLLSDYEPSASDAWRLHNALNYLGLADVMSATASMGGEYSLTVLSLSSDRRALALGPQLAIFAATNGIPTVLVIGPQQDTKTVATLRAACTVSLSSRRRSPLRTTVVDDSGQGWLPDSALTVVVAVVDGKSPHVAGSMHTNTTVLGVSPGVATAEQLARVAASTAADGRQIDGILVADPDPADRTSGRLPQLARHTRQRMPAHVARTDTVTGR